MPRPFFGPRDPPEERFQIRRDPPLPPPPRAPYYPPRRDPPLPPPPRAPNFPIRPDPPLPPPPRAFYYPPRPDPPLPPPPQPYHSRRPDPPLDPTPQYPLRPDPPPHHLRHPPPHQPGPPYFDDAQEYAANIRIEANEKADLRRMAAKERYSATIQQKAQEKAEKKRIAASNRMKKNRQKRTEEEKAADNELNRLRMQLSREERTDEEKAADREDDRLRRQEARARRTEEEKEADNIANRVHMAVVRGAQSEEERAATNTRNRDRMRGWRSNLENVALEQHRRRLREQEDYSHLPIGRQCHWEYFDSSSIEVFSVESEGEFQCFYCSAKGYFYHENQGSKTQPHMGQLCCNKGAMTLPPLPPLPERLEELLTANTAQAKLFRKNTRYFNAQMAFGSIQVNEKTVTNSGPAAFTVCGQMYRRVGPLRNAPNKPPCTIQTYFHDPQFQDIHRAQRNSELPPAQVQAYRDLFRLLREIIEEDADNNLLRSYLIIDEFIETNGLDPDDHAVVLLDSVPTGEHPGRYNLPTAPEVALLLTDDVPNRVTGKQVVMQLRDNGADNVLQFIPYENVNYETVMYPLLFPHGEATRWFKGFTANSGEKVSLRAYVRHLMQDFGDRDNYLLRYNKLWQQYILDMYERNEAYELQYLRSPAGQKKIRAELYNGLADNIRATDGDATNVGRVTVLPASFTGSDRWYHKKYRNAMALVAKYGKPTFFITFTFDVNCPEVQSKLHPGQSPYDRPHLVNRIFQGKRKQLMKELTKDGIFGGPVAHVHVVEFQKRGAPHLHLLLWIKDFPATPDAIDGVISAEIPPPSDPLHEVVKTKHMHGPCGATYGKTNLSCITSSNDGTCKRHFPKPYCDETTLDQGAFGVYRRRSPQMGGHTVKKIIRVRGSPVEVELSNAWVVPYSPYLLARFRCHINVEYCATVLSVKYLFLYHFKGMDKVTIEERDKHDEIRQRQTRQYISTNLGDFRMCEYDLAVIKPAVKQLTVHLPGQQQVYFKPTKDDAMAALQRRKITELTAYFEANADNLYCELTETYATDLRYEEFPHSFVFGEDGDGYMAWKPRQRNPTGVGRMISIHPKKGETFYLRLLLKHRRGATSFDDLRTVEGTLHETYRAACIAMDLTEDDSHWFETMSEAVLVSHARSIRELFANIVLHCEPSEPRALFDHFKDDMKDDLVRKWSQEMSADAAEERAYNDLLLFIAEKLAEDDKQNWEYGLPTPEQPQEAEDYMETPQEEIDDNAEEYVMTNEHLLNQEQVVLVSKVKECIESSKQGLFRLDSPGGTGKTFTSNYLLAMVRSQGHIAIASALSGIAATLLTQGTTFHKRFGAPVPCLADSSSKITLQSKEANVIRKASLLIVDEVSMMSHKLLDLLDRLLQDLMKNDQPMGGKTVLLLYDFRQLLPVVPGKGRPEVVSETVINSSVWHLFEELTLKQNMRVQKIIEQNPEHEAELRQHEQWLLDIGTGTAPTAFSNIIEIPEQMVRKTKKELEDSVFHDFEENYLDLAYLRERLIMSTTNDVIQQCNFDMISRLPGEMIISLSRDSCVDVDDTTMYDEEVLNKINVSGIPPHRLALKVGACIILIKNMNVREQHCNGTRYIISNMTSRLIVAKRLTDGAQLLIPRIPNISNDSAFPIPFKRMQFPVLIAYYLTVNRAQGQSLKLSGLYLERSVYTHGAFYVAISRGGAPWSTYICANQEEFQHLKEHLDLTSGKHFTRNIVYTEVFGHNK